MQRSLLFRIASRALTLAGILLAGCNSPESLVETEKMNILFIAVEDWNPSVIGCYGNPSVQTPHIDALAYRGIRFDRAYCQGTVCNPSRISLTTGLRPETTGAYGNGDHLDNFYTEEMPYMAGILKQKGAHMAQTGKLMHKWKYAYSVINQWDQIEMEIPFATADGRVVDHEPERGPFNGIQKYIHRMAELVPPIPPREWTWDPDPFHDSVLLAKDREKKERLASGEPDTWDLRKPFQQYHAEMLGDHGFAEPHTADGMCTRVALRMIEDFVAEDKQFFLNVGYYAPHTPLHAPAEFINLYDTAQIEISTITRDKDRGVPEIAVRNGRNYDIFNGMYPEFSPTPARQKLAIQSYYAASTFIDYEVGLLLNALEENGIADNTMVILWSDHGFHLGEHGCWSKFTQFEESTRVALVAYVPGAPGNGKASDELVELVDLLPTMCELWGISPHEDFEGLSFVPLLEDPNRPWKKAAYSMVPSPLRGQTVRTKRFRYTEYRNNTMDVNEGEPSDIELYDLESDPHEQHNLAGNPDLATIQSELQAMLYAGWESALPENLSN
jgi:uncharacterized sulfatase